MDELIRKIEETLQSLLTQFALLKAEIAAIDEEDEEAEHCQACQCKMGIYWECVVCTNMVCEDCINDQGVCIDCEKEPVAPEE